MVSRWMAAWPVLLVTAACGPILTPPDHLISTSISPAPPVTGPYELEKLDGVVIGPCCSSHADSGRITGGLLEFGGDVGDDKYTWRLSQVHVYDVSENHHVTRSTSFTFSAGRYTQDGAELTLLDSTGLGSMTGVIDDDVITVATEDHEYGFVRWVPEIRGQYRLTGCWDVDGGPPGCPETDSEGAVVTVVRGNLLIGLSEGDAYAGAYTWGLKRKYEYPDGTSEVIGSLFSAGTYTWDEETLILVDASGDLGPTTGTLPDPRMGLLVVLTPERRYEFGKLTTFPD